jgi:hypothetical protein
MQTTVRNHCRKIYFPKCGARSVNGPTESRYVCLNVIFIIPHTCIVRKACKEKKIQKYTGRQMETESVYFFMK